MRQCRYLNNLVERDHRFVKQRVRAMLSFKALQTARANPHQHRARAHGTEGTGASARRRVTR